MKTRKSLVSNSSSSSFICSICNETETVYEGLFEVEMFECSCCGRILHKGCAGIDKLNEEDIEVFNEALEVENGYEMDPKYCPFCQLKLLDDEDAKIFMQEKYGMNDGEILNEIRDKYTTYSAFLDHVVKIKTAKEKEAENED